MTITEIREILENPYDRAVWKEFLRTQFANNRLAKEDSSLNLGTNDLYKECISLGFYEVDDYTKIGIFEVQIKDNVNLSRNRVGLRNLIKSITQQVAGAMVVFVQGDKWRFSYVSKRKVKNKQTNNIEDKETAPKRYTYLFGKGEKALTAADRFHKLIHKQQANLYQFITLDDFEWAFSVEKLSKDFFNEYKKSYEDFVQFITGKRYIKKGRKFVETAIHPANFQLRKLFNNDEKQARDFCKRMMGRIVFLYFIQKKGWLSVADGKKWGEGNPEFLFDLFKTAKYKDDFYSQNLVPLFFKTLNNPESQHPKNGAPAFPYLNGGLFDDSHDRKFNTLALPVEIFESLFKTFNEFNFTVYEDAPDEHTVAVDPEMLGHIFENLLEDNKDKGAFYTPKEIVHYMCRESLNNYVFTYTQNENNKDFKNRYVQYTENFDVKIFSSNELKQIDRALEDVKICDPAIGSGAFPMGLLHEIYHLKIPIEDSKGFKAKSPADLKKHIIEESIYGVDIDAGAVDIARLRFWLSLVVDEEVPQPLPNLDFKIICANTLISSGYDKFIEIAEKTKTPTLLRMDGEIQKLQSIRNKYFNIGEKENKELLKQEFLNTKEYIQQEFKSLSRTYNLSDFLERIKEWAPFEDSSCTWFDAWWMFGIHEGFDIVIGNPPYVDIKALKREFVKTLVNQYSTAINRINLYSIFIEKGFSLLKENGTLAYIVPNSLLLNDSYSKIRKLILRDLYQLIKLPDAIFENATVETIIIILAKGNNDDSVNSLYFKNDEVPELKNLYFDIQSKNQWLKDELYKFNIFKADKETILLELIEKNNQDLVNEVDFSLGITPYDKAKGHTLEQIKNRIFHSSEKMSNNYVPLIAGKNIQKFKLDFQCDEYLKYGSWLGAPRDKKFFTNPKIIVRQILAGSNLSIISTFTEKETYFTQIGFSIIKKETSSLSLKYVLALLNSRVLNFFHKYKFLDLEKHTFPKILIGNCKKFPTPVLENSAQKPFIYLVDYLLFLNDKESIQIFTHTSNNRIASNIEEVLNMMVFELYFEEHMKNVGLDVLKFIKPNSIEGLNKEEEKTKVIEDFYLWLQTPDNAVRQRINLIDIKSPDILSVINLATQ